MAKTDLIILTYSKTKLDSCLIYVSLSETLFGAGLPNFKQCNTIPHNLFWNKKYCLFFHLILTSLWVAKSWKDCWTSGKNNNKHSLEDQSPFLPYCLAFRLLANIFFLQVTVFFLFIVEITKNHWFYFVDVSKTTRT